MPQDSFSIISPAGYIMDIGVVSPSNGTGTYGNVSVSKILPGGFVQARGRGDYPITGSLSGRQGTMLINCTTGTGGTSQAVAFIAFSPMLLLGVALDVNNRPYALLVDTLGNIIGQSEAAGPTLAAGVPLTIELAWDSQKAVRLGGYAAFQFNDFIANWAPIVTAWVPFVPTTLYVGTSFGGYGFSNFTGNIGKVQVGDIVTFDVTEGEAEGEDLGDSAHLYGSSSTSMMGGATRPAATDLFGISSTVIRSGVARPAATDLLAESDLIPDAKVDRLSLSNLPGEALIIAEGKVVWAAAANLLGDSGLTQNAVAAWAAEADLPGVSDITQDAKGAKISTASLSGSSSLAPGATADWAAATDLPGEAGLAFTASLSGFLTEWVVAGDAAARTITLPLVENRAEGALAYNCTVKWGDGTPDSTVTAFDDADRIHTYAADGTYQVEITGTMEGWSFNNGGDKLKVTKVVSWGNAEVFDGFKYLANGFYGCSNLTSLGVGSILASGTGILSNGFSATFDSCSGLTGAIPAGLFQNHTLVSTNGFSTVFSSCSGLTGAIPVNLFDNNTLAVSFLAAFYGCSGLTSIPANLFRHNILASDFSYTFGECSGLQNHKNAFYADGEQSTRFLNKTIDFTNCFDRALFTGVQGTAPDLWNCDYGETITLDVSPATDWDPDDFITGQTSLATAVIVEKVSGTVYHIKRHIGTFILGEVVGVTGVPSKLADQGAANPTFAGGPVMTDCYNGVGNSLASLDNYGDIPTDWL